LCWENFGIKWAYCTYMASYTRVAINIVGGFSNPFLLFRSSRDMGVRIAHIFVGKTQAKPSSDS